ncbi:mannose-1-phosphate guanylyltransferase [Empedobacter brevis]|uniref:Mannose-1-phosphate guanylyltransferase n=1 Tax=Empedobacter brevis TaxID=247 RepID=A0AAJ1QFZ2_9FLAO|nr:mannose-1-phosphate guanylyltransferase [Empedobacter brevis]MDM1073334.1 mannose-1-phosphate guanylyltransferase [Empedobacter brevis]
MCIYNVILSGGVGSRLWPLSRKSHPKQYLPLFNEQSLFELTIQRNRSIADKLIVIGNKDNDHLSQEVLNNLDVEYTKIVEAVPRNTAAAIAFAALAVDDDDILIVTPSDHLIEDLEAYDNAMKKAIDLAQKDYIVTFGIHPTRPETGYGYIEHKGDNVLSFREKPNHITAQDFIEQGNFLWNSGMFCFKAKVLLKELKKFEKEIYDNSKIVWKENTNGELNEELSMNIPSNSIDYAVMERSKKIKVVPAKFIWNDLGSFESLYDYFVLNGHYVDRNGNMVIGTGVYTSFVGLQNTIFVHTPTANLILQKEYSQEVKNVYTHLEKRNSELI